MSTSGLGISGTSSNSFGVLGTSTTSVGISGHSTNYLGVYGSGATYGVYGSATSGYGAVGLSTSSIGVYGSGSTYGVYGTGGSNGVVGSSSSGVGVYASSGSVRAFEGHTSSGLGLLVTGGSGNGGDVSGTYIGVVARATSFPIVATDPTGANNLFYVDGSGDVFYRGTLNAFAVTRSGSVATAFSPKTTSQTVEDTGSGQLINGMAMVSLDPAFAQTIDLRTPYHVMLTPDGDTRGLFVASKGPTGFVVREVQGGRNSLAFDYHIYASALGHAGERMTVMTRAAAAAMLPRAPIVTRMPNPSIPAPLLKPPR